MTDLAFTPEPNTLRELVSAAVAGRVSASEKATVSVEDDLVFDVVWNSTVLNIQAILTCMRRISELTLVWSEQSFSRFSAAPNSAPLLSACSLHNRIRHVVGRNGTVAPLAGLRTIIGRHRLSFDWFSGPQAIFCADHLGLGRPKDLYASTDAPGIRPREDFEQLVFPFIERQLAVDVDEKKAFKWREALASVLYELFENTELHGKTDTAGRLLSPSIRGMLFRDNPLEQYQKKAGGITSAIRCIEIGVIDTGIGYFEKSQRKPLTSVVPLQEEWHVLHECLSTHLEDSVDAAADRGMHGIGLYEVLRALKFLNGAIEIRTGRLHGYRSFLPGDLPLQMESAESKERPNMPKATLLDYQQRYLKRPTEHPLMLGSTVRVLIPLL